MDEKRTSWPIVVGIGAGMLVGIIAAIILYSEKNENADDRLHDARDIIDQCHRQIEDIEQSIAALHGPVSVQG